ncbi:uncharacterized protein LOC132935527 [Metopolophium dirhodum]|uniref:uncharacterized protein LOC132935527 n=1 Tax=Metopolophium dirhodum TaxID=44670 RepID=UPI00298F5438|nr:uncharacterized protein LOC132935527 [Metopolophium dirhodum]
MPSTYVFALSLVCVALAVNGAADSVPPPPPQGQQQSPPQQQQQRQEDGAGSTGLGAVLWSVLDDCFGDGDAAEPATVCLKSKALTALDRALGKPVVTVAGGVTLTARAGKSLQAVDPQADQADRTALDAAPDADSKNALLDDMLANRMDRLMSTRTIVLDGSGQEGRKKKDKAMQQALMMAGMMAAGIMGPMALKIIALMAGKALLLSKIALLLSGLMMLKKLFQPQQMSGHNIELPSSGHHYDRNSIDANHAAYSGQIQ